MIKGQIIALRKNSYVWKSWPGKGIGKYSSGDLLFGPKDVSTLGIFIEKIKINPEKIVTGAKIITCEGTIGYTSMSNVLGVKS